MTPAPDPASGDPTAILAEDEPLLAEELAEQLDVLWPRLRILASVGDGVAALHAIETHSPRFAFLDIRMPRLSGIEVARQIAGRCHVIFITAYDEHAIEAFEAGAVDYVLKPFTTARLVTTVQRLKARALEMPPNLTALAQRPTEFAPAKRHLQWVNATRGATVRLITVDEISYFKADNKYTMVVTESGESLIRKTIKELAEELDPTMFWQVHRSSIVNVGAIESVNRDARGNLILKLKHRPEALPVSEAYTHLFRQM